MFAVLMIGLLSAQLVHLVQQRDIVDRQLEIAEAQRDTVLNVLEGGRDLGAEVQDRLPGARAGLRRAERMALAAIEDVDATRGLVGETLAVTEDTRAIAADTRDIGAEGVGLTRELTDLQRRALSILEQSLAIQRETLTHVRSLDRKTGGPLPAP